MHRNWLDSSPDQLWKEDARCDLTGVLAAIGKTPLVELTKVLPGIRFRLLAKLESANPGGSAKDRPALGVIRHSLQQGVINQDTVIVESSSGNMGVGLAQACSHYGLRFVCVVDPKTTQQNLSLLHAYGARTIMVPDPDPLTGEFLQARINRVRQLLSEVPNSYWPNQYANPQNPIAHRETMREIVSDLKSAPQYVFCATSTCGTIRGCHQFVRHYRLKTKLIAVDAVGSVIFGGKRGMRLIPGHGAAIRPKLFSHEIADEVIYVNDLDCVLGCRFLARREGILAGGSSGGVIRAVAKVMEKIPDGSTCVAILPDRGERYLDTVYSDSWVRVNLNVPDDELTHFDRSNDGL